MKNSKFFFTAWVAELKRTLVKKLSAEYAFVGEALVYQAVNEADALAAQTPVPYLILPTLAEEKVQKLAAWTVHQRAVRADGSMALAARNVLNRFCHSS
jgi:hypothetical protein